MWSGANMAFALCPELSQGAMLAVERHGSEALRGPYLEPQIAARRSRPARPGRAARGLTGADDRGALGGVEVPDRAPGGLRARGPDHARRAAQGSLPYHRPPDPYHLGRSPDGGEHRAPRSP